MIYRYIFRFLLFTSIIFAIYFNFQAFKNFQAQNTIILDNPKYELSYHEVDSLLANFPNISATAMPLDIWRVQYLIFEGRFDEAKKFVSSAVKTNPHVFVGEFLQGKIFFNEQKYDSAFYYSKKAFFGWPKNIEHYNSYVDVLEKTKDTSSLIAAFNILDSNLRLRPEYFKRFYSSFNRIKLDYLITEYNDERNVNYDDLVGETFQRVYNFPNNQTIIDSSTSYTFINKTIVSNIENIEYLYNIKNDTFSFYYKSDFKIPISTFISKFSDEYETLIFKNVPMGNDKYQNQFYKVIKN
jgi:tetratricopeptide (TPR) repeat protein